MKKFTIGLLSTVFVALIACSIQSISADHFEPGQELIKDSKYKLHVQVVVRNTDNQLLSVTETMGGVYVPHKITDDAFDTFMGKKKIVTIDDIKYEKAQYTFSPTLEQRWIGMYPIFEQISIKFDFEADALVQINKKTKDYSLWKIHYCADFTDIGHPDGLQCIPIFQVLVPIMSLEPSDVITHHWTILRDLN